MRFRTEQCNVEQSRMARTCRSERVKPWTWVRIQVAMASQIRSAAILVLEAVRLLFSLFRRLLSAHERVTRRVFVCDTLPKPKS